MKLITSATHIAVSAEIRAAVGNPSIDIEKTCMTPYGFFFPIHLCTHLFRRVLIGDLAVDEIKKQSKSNMTGAAIMVDHTAQATLLSFNSSENDIMHIPLCGHYEVWGVNLVGHDMRDTTDAMRLLLKSCSSIENAVERFNSFSIAPMAKMAFYSYEQLAQRLKETGNTKVFAYTSFDSPPPKPKWLTD